MIRQIEPTNFMQLTTRNPVVDVRSPGEFSQGHVPGAINIPLFDDTERAIIGTLYVKSGKEDAILKGLDIALPKVDWYIHTLRKTLPAGDILIHCWRGGMRSAVMAEVFSKAGYDVDLLQGGYKAYRRFIRSELGAPSTIIVLGGFTGSGKTELLHEIASRGEQVIDLEALACHKGSVFGALGQPEQPTNEQFENNLYARWSALNHSRMVWVEDESRMIGRITLPDPLVEHITNSTLIRVELDNEIRIARLVMEYAGFDQQLLAGAIKRIGDRVGGEGTKEAMKALEDKRFDVVAAIVLAYYDKAYLFSMDRRKNKSIHDIHVSGTDMVTDAARIIEFAYKII